MGEKLLRLMKSEGLTSSRLAEILGTGASNISHIISGRSKPGYDLLRKILLSFPQINPDWLLLDDETMYRSDETPIREQPVSPDLFTAESATTFRFPLRNRYRRKYGYRRRSRSASDRFRRF
jgi:transcriptional regulator with XRE-family HTH domain